MPDSQRIGRPNACILALATSFCVFDFGVAKAQQYASPAGPSDGIPWVLLGIIFICYFAPTLIAFARKHPNRWPIFMINLLFGGTGLGWIGSLIWAFRAAHKSVAGSDGGESGLNIFANDPVKVEVTSNVQRATTATDVLDRLERLQLLRQQGVITDAEFETLKASAFHSL